MKFFRLPIILAILSFSILGCSKESNKVENTFLINGLADIEIAGNTTKLNLDINQFSGIAERVTLSVEGLPKGMKASFSTISGVPNFSTILEFHVTDDIVPGVYPIKVVGKSAIGERQNEIFIKVAKASYMIIDGKQIRVEPTISFNSLGISYNGRAPQTTPYIQFVSGIISYNSILKEGVTQLSIDGSPQAPDDAISVNYFDNLTQVTYSAIGSTGKFAKLLKDGNNINLEIPEVELFAGNRSVVVSALIIKP